jgi:hypothetical protein
MKRVKTKMLLGVIFAAQVCISSCKDQTNDITEPEQEINQCRMTSDGTRSYSWNNEGDISVINYDGDKYTFEYESGKLSKAVSSGTIDDEVYTMSNYEGSIPRTILKYLNTYLRDSTVIQLNSDGKITEVNTFNTNGGDPYLSKEINISYDGNGNVQKYEIQNYISKGEPFDFSDRTDIISFDNNKNAHIGHVAQIIYFVNIEVSEEYELLSTNNVTEFKWNRIRNGAVSQSETMRYNFTYSADGYPLEKWDPSFGRNEVFNFSYQNCE